MLIWDLVGRLGGNLFAKSFAAVGMLCSALIRLNILFQPNSVDILCFTLVFYTLIRYIQSGKDRWLYFARGKFCLRLFKTNTPLFSFAIGLFPALVLTRRSIFQNQKSLRSFSLRLAAGPSQSVLAISKWISSTHSHALIE